MLSLVINKHLQLSLGYFRVNYDKENWNLIKDQLLTAPEEIHPINRAQIMDDSFTFALDEKLSFSLAINILAYLKYERDPLPWYTALQKLQHLFTQYEVTSVGGDLKVNARVNVLQQLYHISLACLSIQYYLDFLFILS